MIMKKQIKNLFINPQETMMDGLWFSGHEREGEYKEWYMNGQLWEHSFYKEDKEYTINTAKELFPDGPWLA